MALQIYNTLTRSKVAFEPIEPGKINMYVCGPTVYDLSHVGHARVYVAIDAIVRFLRRRYAVTYVRNYTDVDDKIIGRAALLHEDPQALAGRFIQEFESDMQALGNAPPDVSPRVTDHMPETLALITTLVERNHAYVAGGDVLYAVESFANYGQLSRRSLDDMQAGARVQVGAHKRHPMDFALWKGAKPGEPSWPSPWGDGRPGWHIECSAMSKKYLGQTFDIHAGGRDLMFPHHENEIAQSQGSCDRPMSRWWVHNGLVNIDNEKMSKSLGNFFTIRQVLEKFDAQSLRFYLLTTHYRSPINFSDVALAEAERRVRYFYETLVRLEERLAGTTYAASGSSESTRGAQQDAKVIALVPRFCAAMEDDFNTPEAIGALSDAFRIVNDILTKTPETMPLDEVKTLRVLQASIADFGQVLGLFLQPPAQILQRINQRRQKTQGIDAKYVEARLAARAQARAQKDYAQADAIRQELSARHIVIFDGPTETTWAPA